MQWECLIFDFDGVILNSNAIRMEGFIQIFKEEKPENVGKLLEMHARHGGVSRYAKIRWFYEEVLKRPITDEKVFELAGHFSEIMRRELTNPDFLFQDTLDFLRVAVGHWPLHIASGADEQELYYLCHELGIDAFFTSIHGSPTPKSENIAALLEERAYVPDQVCLIGDSEADCRAAETNGIRFFGYNNERLKKMSYASGYIKSFQDQEFFPIGPI